MDGAVFHRLVVVIIFVSIVLNVGGIEQHAQRRVERGIEAADEGFVFFLVGIIGCDGGGVDAGAGDDFVEIQIDVHAGLALH